MLYVCEVIHYVAAPFRRRFDDTYGHFGAPVKCYKKLSCRRKTARRLVSLNILLSHSSSLKIIRITLLSRACVSTSLKLYLYVVPFMMYSASKNGVTLKLGVGVIQDH